MSYVQIRALFERLSTLDPSERYAVFDSEKVPPSVRAEVERLLAVTDRADPIADRIADAASDALDDAVPERLGPYRVLGTLGEGGMGVVLLAERADGEFEKKVAIKLIRGLSSRDARDRLRRERQVLAALDHPHIAALLDGGTTAAGEPYLVMEYVEGEVLGEYVERANPPLAARLHLFLALCDAVHHAHQHLVVHRDLKPGNVIVRPDGSPVLLDFGIAKLLEPTTTEEAPRTATRIMTPQYASPEQLIGKAVTTASDVFALGLILFELLTTRLPDRQRAAETQSELPAPSRIASERRGRYGIEAKKLRGDLDRIVRHAVRNDVTERYPSAAALAADVRAYLEGRPVQAAGRQWRYALGKFVMRHRLGVALAALAVAALIVGSIELKVERDRAVAAEARASQEADTANEVTTFLVELFGELDVTQHPGRNLSARELLDIGRDRIAAVAPGREDVRARLQQSMGQVYVNAGQPNDAVALLEAARAKIPLDTMPVEHIRTETALARAYEQLDRYQDGWNAADSAQRNAARLLPDEPKLRAHALMTRGVSEQSLSRFDESQASFAEAQTLFEAAGEAGKQQLDAVLHNRAWAAENAGNIQQALIWYEQALAGKREKIGPDHPSTLYSLQGYASALAQSGRNEEAAKMLEELSERATRVMGPLSETAGAALNELGSVNQDLGRYALSKQYYERAIATARALAKGEDGLGVAQPINNYATLLEERGDAAGAEAAYRESLAIRRRALAPDHPSVARAAHNLGRALLVMGRTDEARPLIEEARESRAAKLPATHPDRLISEALTAQLAAAEGDRPRARATLSPVLTAIARGDELPPLLRALAFQIDASLADEPALRVAAMQRAVEAAKGQLPAGHPRLLQVELGLAEAELAAGARGEAQLRYRRIAPVLRRELDPSAAALARLEKLEQALR